MEKKRFFTLLKNWHRLDTSWTAEFVNLDTHFRGIGAKQSFEVDDKQGHPHRHSNS